jgi:hypothetical protein
MTRTLLALVLLSLPAFGEAQKPKLAVHPLVLEGVDSKKDRDDLTALLPGIIIAIGKVEIASPSDVDSELKKKGQAFCSPENLFKCLSYIADHTSSVHAIRIELRRGGRPREWEILANVVCVDGSVQRQPEIFTFTQSETVKFLPIARSKLEEFVATLKLNELPVSPPAKAATPVVTEPPKTTPTPTKIDAPVVTRPVQMETTGGKLRMASYILGAGAAASLLVAGGFGISAKADSDSLHVEKGGIPQAQIPVAQRVDSATHTGTVFLVIGGLVGATAITMFLISDPATETPVVAPAVVPGGAGVVFSSRF